MLYANRQRVIDFAARRRLPTSYPHPDGVRDGALIGYSPVYGAHYTMAAEYVAKILKGAKPSELPVEQSTRFELLINVGTARRLGIAPSAGILARAEEVVE